MNNTRRTFFFALAAGGSMLSTAAKSQAKLDEKDPQAVALGYFADATKTDTKKFPKYAAGQVCTNCALYQGKANDAVGDGSREFALTDAQKFTTEKECEDKENCECRERSNLS